MKPEVDQLARRGPVPSESRSPLVNRVASVLIETSDVDAVEAVAIDEVVT
jgi:hypothetical protein